MSRFRPAHRVAKGYAKGESRRCVVTFDTETFSQIRQRAIDNSTSFAEEIRTLVEWGLESAA